MARRFLKEADHIRSSAGTGDSRVIELFILRRWTPAATSCVLLTLLRGRLVAVALVASPDAS